MDKWEEANPDCRFCGGSGWHPSPMIANELCPYCVVRRDDAKKAKFKKDKDKEK